MPARTAPRLELLKDATLRDYAAVEFMKELIAIQGVTNNEADAKRAYSLADTLLAEREKRQELEAELEAEVDAIIG